MQGTIICGNCLGVFQYKRKELEEYFTLPKCPYCGARVGKDKEETAEIGENNIYQNREWDSYFSQPSKS